MEDSNFSASELEQIKNPNEKLNVNSSHSLNKEEKIKALVSSRTFTFWASVCTGGLYYLYYLFCLEQIKASPFNTERNYSEDLPVLKTDQEREFEELNKKFCNVIQGKKDKNIEVKKEGVRLLERRKNFLSIAATEFIHGLEKIILKLTGKEIEIDLIQKIREKKSNAFSSKEEQIKRAINKKLKENIHKRKQEEFDIEKSLTRSLQSRNWATKDYFLSFIFYASYIVAGIVTLGAFPVYHLVIKERWKDLLEIKNHKEYANMNEFDERIERLINSKGELEYSVLLLSSTRLPLAISGNSDAFRTQIFKDKKIRIQIAIFLMIITGGLFGIWVVAKNAFDKKRLSIDSDDAIPSNYGSADSKQEKFIMFLKDLWRDIKIGVKLASQKEANINKSLRSLIPSKNDKYIDLFMKIISSDIYLLIFCMSFILGSVALLSMFTTLAFGYIATVSLLILFLSLFTKHISLLFI